MTCPTPGTAVWVAECARIPKQAPLGVNAAERLRNHLHDHDTPFAATTAAPHPTRLLTTDTPAESAIRVRAWCWQSRTQAHFFDQRGVRWLATCVRACTTDRFRAALPCIRVYRSLTHNCVPPPPRIRGSAYASVVRSHTDKRTSSNNVVFVVLATCVRTCTIARPRTPHHPLHLYLAYADAPPRTAAYP